ncbi:helix-turn-helix transcriptional regulator [Candidatus Riflebacteria bacterium]
MPIKKLLKSTKPIGEGDVYGRKVVFIAKSSWDKLQKAVKDDRPVAKVKPGTRGTIKPVTRKKPPLKKSKPANNLLAKRTAAKLTQGAVGKKVGVTGRTVGRWEAGIYVPDQKQMKKLAKALKTSQAGLFSGTK